MGTRLKGDKGWLSCGHPCLELVGGNVESDDRPNKSRGKEGKKECGGGKTPLKPAVF